MSQHTTLRKSEHLRRGEVLVIFGVGTFTINGFRKIGPGEVLITLAWSELAVVAHPGQQWHVIAGSGSEAIR